MMSWGVRIILVVVLAAVGGHAQGGSSLPSGFGGAPRHLGIELLEQSVHHSNSST